MIRFEMIHTTHYYQNRKILTGLSFSCGQGEIIIVKGENGSGKTTLCRIAAGLLFPTSGEVTLSVDSIKCNRSSGGSVFIPHESNWYQSMSGRENVEFFLRGDRTACDRAEILVDDLGLSDAYENHTRTYSAGMMRRLSIAAAFSAEAPMKIFDEPESHLDENGLRIFCDLVLKNSGDCITIIATHNSSIDFGRVIHLE